MIFVHIGLPKAASSFLQINVFNHDERLTFHGIIRDHDDLSIEFSPTEGAASFDQYVRGKTYCKEALAKFNQSFDNKDINVKAYPFASGAINIS